MLESSNQTTLFNLIHEDLDTAFELLRTATATEDSLQATNLIDQVSTILALIRDMSNRIQDSAANNVIHTRADELERAIQVASSNARDVTPKTSRASS